MRCLLRAREERIVLSSGVRLLVMKVSITQLVNVYTHNPDITSFYGYNKFGQIICGLTISFLLLFPVSLVRKISSLTIVSMGSIIGSVYLSIAVTMVFFSDKQFVPSPMDNLAQMDAFRLNIRGLISSGPLIVYAYMYQINIPCIYEEVIPRTPK